MRLPRGLPKLRSLQHIKPPDSLAYMKNGSVPAFTAKYSPNYAFPTPAAAKLEHECHPVYPVICGRYETRSEPLWIWLVLGKNVSGKKATVRRWLLRRMKEAFTQALKESGYKRDGSKISQLSSLKPELRGTLTFIIQPGLFEVKHKSLLSNSRKVLGTVMEWCGKRKSTQENKNGGYNASQGRESQKGWDRPNYNRAEQRDGGRPAWKSQSLNRPAQQDTGNYRSAGRQNTYQTPRPRVRSTPSGQGQW